MTATRPSPRPIAARKTRPVTELLLEIAYRLHATRVVARPPTTDHRIRVRCKPNA